MDQSTNTYQPSLFVEPPAGVWPDSADDFRDGFAELFGHPPHALTGQAELCATWLGGPLGGMVAVTDGDRLHLLEFSGRRALRAEMRRLSRSVKGRIGLGRSGVTDRLERALADYFAGRDAGFAIPLAQHGTPFQREVWAALLRIPAGETRSYARIACEIGRPTATRAVARANGANQIAVLIPCHRVIGADGALTGYGGGLWRKQELLRLEQIWRKS